MNGFDIVSHVFAVLPIFVALKAGLYHLSSFIMLAVFVSVWYHVDETNDIMRHIDEFFSSALIIITFMLYMDQVYRPTYVAVCLLFAVVILDYTMHVAIVQFYGHRRVCRRVHVPVRKVHYYRATKALTSRRPLLCLVCHHAVHCGRLFLLGQGPLRAQPMASVRVHLSGVGHRASPRRQRRRQAEAVLPARFHPFKAVHRCDFRALERHRVSEQHARRAGSCPVGTEHALQNEERSVLHHPRRHTSRTGRKKRHHCGRVACCGHARVPVVVESGEGRDTAGTV